MKSSDFHTSAHQYHNIKVPNKIDLRSTGISAIAALLIAFLSVMCSNHDYNSIDHRAAAQIATTATTGGFLLKPTTLISELRNDPDYLAHLSLEKSFPTNPHPIANATVSPNQIIHQSTGNVTLDGSKSYDADGNITRYLWQQIAGPPVRLNSTTAPAVKFNTTCDTLGNELKFKLTVTDNNDLSDSALVDVKFGYSAKPAICKEAVFSPLRLPISFTTGKSYIFRVDFGTKFISVDKVAAISTFEAADPFGLGDGYSIANFGTTHNHLGDGGRNNNNNSSSTSSSVNNGGFIGNNTTSARNSSTLKEDFASRAPNNPNGNLTATTLTKKDTNTTNRFLQGNFTSSYSSINGSFTLTSLKFCVKGTPKIGNETNNDNDKSNLIKPVSLTIVRPTKMASAESEPSFSRLPTSFKNTTMTNSSVTFDPECNIIILTPTTTNNTRTLSSITTADDKNTTRTNNANKFNSDLAAGNGSQIGAAQNQQQQQQPLLQQGQPYQSSSPPTSLVPQPPYPYTNPYVGTYPYSGPLNQYQQPYPYPYPNPLYPYPNPNPPYPINQPPIANAGPNQVVNQLSAVTLDGTGSYDPDGGTITSYRWQQISGTPVVTLSGANTATPTFIAPSILADTTLTFLLSVTDSDGGGSSSDTVNVLVQRSSLSNPPIANAGPNQVVNQLSAVTLDGTGSYDPDGGTIVSYSWIQTAGIPVLLNGANTATPTFTAPVVSFDTILAFRLKVINNNGIVSNNPAIAYITVKSNLQ